MAREWILVLSATFFLPAMLGCATPCPEPEVLANHADWTLVPLDADPFMREPGADLRPCDERDVRMELFGSTESFTVDTNLCNWATVSQPLSVSLRAGDQLRVRAFWFSQSDFPAARATLAVRVGAEVLVERHVPIPSEEELLDEVVVLTTSHPPGAPLYFHVGNHGANTWNILQVTREGGDECVE